MIPGVFGGFFAHNPDFLIYFVLSARKSLCLQTKILKSRHTTYLWPVFVQNAMSATVEFTERSGLSPTWHSGLKTLPNARRSAGILGPQRANPSMSCDTVSFLGTLGSPDVYQNGPPRDRWDVENVKVVRRSASVPPSRSYVHTGEWSSGLKTLERDGMGPFDIMQHSEYGSLSPKLYGQPSRQMYETLTQHFISFVCLQC